MPKFVSLGNETMNLPFWVYTTLFAYTLLYLTACTSTEVSGEGKELENIRVFQIGLTETYYGESLSADRIALAREHQVVEQVARLVEQWMIETGRWAGNDRVRIEIDRFRLPNSMRWVTAQAKGSDYLGVQVSVLHEEAIISTFHVEHTIGWGDRSIAENYSANRSLENLVEAVAWSVVHTLTPFEDRRPIFEIGKREQIERAIEMLELCGDLSYTETLKYISLGLISIKTASGAEARRLKRAFGGKLQRCY